MLCEDKLTSCQCEGRKGSLLRSPPGFDPGFAEPHRYDFQTQCDSFENRLQALLPARKLHLQSTHFTRAVYHK